MSGRPLTPLVIRFGAFGDMILLIPVLKLLERRYGVPCDVVASGSWSEPLLQRVAPDGRRFFLTSRRAPYWLNRSQQQLVRWLKQRAIGPVYVFEPDEKPLSLLRRAGVKPDWICTLRDYPRQSGEHLLAHSLRIARETPAALRGTRNAPIECAEVPNPRPTLSEQDRRDCADWLASRGVMSPIILLQPGNKKTMKRGDRRRRSNIDYWPESNWAKVVLGVRQTIPGAHVIICGTPAERPIGEDIAALLPANRDRVLIASDELPIPRLLALQERAHSMISVNTGPAHAAAAMGCPLLVMFTRHAHRAADLYAPVPTTAPVKILQPEAALAGQGLSAITPESVIAAWRNLVA